MSEITSRIRNLLESHNIPYREIDHGIATTCEDSARERGADIRIGGKTLLFKDKKDFRLFVISAAKQVDSKKVRKILGSQYLRFATSVELEKLCGVVSGALPPFGEGVYPYDLFMDESILENDEIAFNAGILTKSFILQLEDYLKVVSPTICSFSK